MEITEVAKEVTESHKEDDINFRKENTNEVEIPFRQKCKLMTKVLLTVILPILSIGAFSCCPIGTIEDQLVYVKLGGVINNGNGSTESNASCSSNNTAKDDIQIKTSEYRLFMRYGSCFATFLFIPVWGTFTDKHGRHIGVVIACIGAMILTGSLLLVELVENAPLWILIFAEVLHGLCGRSITTLVMVLSAHVADVMPYGNRIFMMIMIDFIHSSFAFAGDVVVGYMIKHSGFITILAIMLIMQSVLMLYGIFIFSKISKPLIVAKHQNDNLDKSAREVLVEYCLNTYKLYLKRRRGNYRLCLFLITVIILIFNVAYNGVDSVINIFALGPPLCWTSVVLGIFSGVSAGTSGFLPVIVGTLFIKKGTSSWFLFAGLTSGLIGQSIFSFATTTMVMFIALVVSSLSNIVGSTSRAVISDLVDTKEQGAAMAGYVLTCLVGEIAGNTIFTAIYTSTITDCVHCFFYAATGLYFCAIIFLSCNICIKKDGSSADDRAQLIQET